MDQKVNAYDMEKYGKGSGYPRSCLILAGYSYFETKLKVSNFQREIVLEMDKEMESEHLFSMGEGTPLTPVHVA